MESDMEDMHVCLKCNSCIVGLENYVIHRKSECPGDASMKDGVSPRSSPRKPPSASVSPAKSPAKAAALQQHVKDISKGITVPPETNQSPSKQTPQQDKFTCPGCKGLFDVELAYLAHVRVCPDIDWQNTEDNEGSTSDDSTKDKISNKEADDQVIQKKLIKAGHEKCGEDLDFRNIQADNNYHCILCTFKTHSKDIIRNHVRTKEHSELLHQYVEKQTGKTFSFFVKNDDNLLRCTLCGWQAKYRVEMEIHLCQRVHHENIMRLVDPEYSIFGKGTEDTYNDESPKEALDLGDDEISEWISSYGKLSVNDGVDKILSECLRKTADNLFYCKVCDYSSQGKNDMKHHLVRKLHVIKVDLLKSHMANNNGVLDMDVLKSIRQNSKYVAGNKHDMGVPKPSTKEDVQVGVEQSSINAEQSSADQSRTGVKESRSDAEQSGLDVEQSGTGVGQSGLDVEQSRSGAEQSGLDAEQSGLDAEQPGLNVKRPGSDTEHSGSGLQQSEPKPNLHVPSVIASEQTLAGTEHTECDVKPSAIIDDQSKYDKEQTEKSAEQPEADKHYGCTAVEITPEQTKNKEVLRQSENYVKVNITETNQSECDSIPPETDLKQSDRDAKSSLEEEQTDKEEIGSDQKNVKGEMKETKDEAMIFESILDSNDSTTMGSDSDKQPSSATRRGRRKRKPNFKYMNDFEVDTCRDTIEIQSPPSTKPLTKQGDSSIKGSLKRSRGRPRKDEQSEAKVINLDCESGEEDEDMVEIQSTPSTKKLTNQGNSTRKSSQKRGRGRPRKDKQSEAKVINLNGESDEEDDDIVEIPFTPDTKRQINQDNARRKGRGRPRKEEVRVSPRGRDRKQKYEQPEVKVTVSGRGRPRKVVRYTDGDDDDEEEEEEKEVDLQEENPDPSWTESNVKRGRGRPPKRTTPVGCGRPKKIPKTKVSPDSDIEEGMDSEEMSVQQGKGNPEKQPLLTKFIQSPKVKRGRGRPRGGSLPPDEAWTSMNLSGSKFFSMEFCCELCQIGYNVLKPLTLHVKNSKHIAELTKAKKQKKNVIKCQNCPSLFLSNESFDNHQERHELTQNHHKGKTYHCDTCVFSFVSEDMLIRHKDINCKGGSDEEEKKDEENLNKDDDDDDDDDDEDYDPNEEKKEGKKVKGNRLFVCEICDVSLSSRNGLVAHMGTIGHEAKVSEEQGKAKTFQCELCWATFSTIRVFDAHLEKHTQAKQNVKICAHCKEVVPRDEYKKHCKEAGHEDIKQANESGFKCDVCDKILMTSASLADHKYIHTGQRPHKCPLCPYRARRRGDISIHIKRHLGIRAFQCDECELKFVKKSSLLRHKECHNPERPRNIKCNLCDATFYNRSILRVHRRNVHEEDAMVPCQEKGCTHMARTQSALRTHMRMHTKEKPYLCTICGRASATRKAMVIHQRIHTGDKPYKCTYEGCTYAARFGTHLQRHLRVHTGEKPYKCPHCPYRANVQENLRKHIKNSKKHKGLKMYKCNRCDVWQGDTMQEMINHIRIDHGIYVKRLEVANETGILQYNTGTQPDGVSLEEERTDETASSGSTELDIDTMPLMEGDGQKDYQQHVENESSAREEQHVVNEGTVIHEHNSSARGQHHVINEGTVIYEQNSSANEGDYQQHVVHEGTVAYEQSSSAQDGDYQQQHIVNEGTVTYQQDGRTIHEITAQVPSQNGIQVPSTVQNVIQVPSTVQNVIQVPSTGQNVIQVPSTMQNVIQVPSTMQNVIQVPAVGQSVRMVNNPQLVISATLQPQERQQGVGQLVVRLEERVADIFNSLMSGGIG